MSRNNQKLINYHSSGTSESNALVVSNLNYGEIAVRHNPDEPRLYVRTGENTYATFIDSASVNTMIIDGNETVMTEVRAVSGALYSVSGSLYDVSAQVITNKANISTNTSEIGTLRNDLETVSDDLETLSGDFHSFSGYIETNYLDKQGVEDAIANAITGDSGITKDLEALSGSVKAFSAYVVTNYATTGHVQDVSGWVYNAATAYTDSASGNIESTINALSGAVTGIESTVKSNKTSIETNAGNITKLQTDVTNLSGGVEAVSASVIGYIDNKLSVVYKYKGSVATIGNLPNEENEVGDVYNVVSANGEPGQPDYTPAGTNYAWTGDQWDALGGTVDLSNYVTQSQLNSATATTAGVSQRLDALSGSVSAFSAYVVTNYATKEELKTASGNAITKATELSSAYTDTVSGRIASTLNEFSGAVVNNYYTKTIIDNKNQEITNDITKLKNFSGYVETNYATKAHVQDVSGWVYNASTAYTKQASGHIESTINALSGSVVSIEGRVSKNETDIGNLNTKVTNLEKFSGHVETVIVPKVNSALQGFELKAIEGSGKTTQSGAKADYTAGGNAILDLSNLVIDCGDF